jgi:hypothetical protein
VTSISENRANLPAAAVVAAVEALRDLRRFQRCLRELAVRVTNLPAFSG